MEKFIAYYRVSTKKQSLGIDVQRNTILNYIKIKKAVLISEFSEKESGKNNNRMELERAINDCKTTNSTLIIAKLDRLSRNISFIFALRDSGINFYCCDLPELNTLTLGFFATIAQHERETISKRTKEALAAKKAQGIKLGNPNAKFTSNMRNMAAKTLKEKADNNPNNKRAYIVIITLREKGLSLGNIANYLNKNEFRTSKGYLFTAISVSRIIKRYG